MNKHFTIGIFLIFILGCFPPSKTTESQAVNIYQIYSVPDWNDYVLTKDEFQVYIKQYNDSLTNFDARIKVLKDKISKFKNNQNANNTEVTKNKKDLQNTIANKNNYAAAIALMNKRAALNETTKDPTSETEVLNRLNCDSWLSFLDIKKGDDISRAIELLGSEGKYSAPNYGGYKYLSYYYEEKLAVQILYATDSRIIREIFLSNLDGKAFIKSRKSITDTKYLIIGIKRQRLRDAMDKASNSYSDGNGGAFQYSCPPTTGNHDYCKFWADEKNNFNISGIFVQWIK
jgi:hypothetical protein